MKTRILILVGSIAAACAVQAQSPVLQYTFEGGTPFLNLGTLGGAGTTNGAGVAVTTGGPASGFSGGAGGNVLSLPGTSSADDVVNGTFLNTLLTATALGFTTDNYTAGAWVNMNSFGGDAMIFGQTGAPFLHNGIRDNSPHLGHWGADTTASSTNLATTIGTGNWFHLTFRYNGDEQSIYLNGNLVARNSAGNLPNSGNVVIGNSGNGGGLPGFLDDVVVYNSTLKQNQIAFLAAGGNPSALPAGAAGVGGITYAVGAVAPTVLAGPANPPSGSSDWGVREVRGAGNLNSVVDAYNALNGGGGTITDGFRSVINATDLVGPGNGPGGGGLNLGTRNPYLGDIAGDDENVAFLYRAKVRVFTAGAYTFNTHSDDGFVLRIGDFSWSSSSGAGNIDFDDARTLNFFGGTGDSNTRGTIQLPVGDHVIEFLTYEGGGGSGHQLSYAKGTFANDGDAVWRILGGPLASDTTNNIPGVTAAGWTVNTSTPSADGLLTTNALAKAALLASGTTTTNVVSINYNDPGFGGPGSIAGDIPFPKDTAADDEDFAIQANAILHIDEADTYLFGFQGDDGGYLSIAGVSGWTIVDNATGLAYVADIDGTANPLGNTLWADVLTGNSRTVGSIFLTPGDYAIEGLFFERGGGSFYEIFGGDADAGSLVLLAAGGNQNVPVLNSDQLQIVPEPGSLTMMLGGIATLLGMRRRRK